MVHKPVIPALGRLRQEDGYELEASLNFIMRPDFKKLKINEQNLLENYYNLNFLEIISFWGLILYFLMSAKMHWTESYVHRNSFFNQFKYFLYFIASKVCIWSLVNCMQINKYL